MNNVGFKLLPHSFRLWVRLIFFSPSLKEKKKYIEVFMVEGIFIEQELGEGKRLTTDCKCLEL